MPDRVVGHLLGDDTPEPGLAAVLGGPAGVTWGDPAPLAGALEAGIRLVYLREPATGSGRVLAAEALRSAGYGRYSLT